MRPFAAISALLLTSTLYAQTSVPAPATSAPPASAAQPSALANYHSDTLHLTYSYPASYTDATAMVGPAMQASLSGDPAAAAQAACISIPLSRMDTSNGAMGMVILVRADAACFKKKFNAKSVTEAAQDEVRSIAASGAKTSFGQPVSYTVANHPAALLVGSFALPTGQTMQAMISCVLDQPDIACWQFLATNTDRLRTMSTFPVTFDNNPATPLIPNEVLTKP
jgi:hypothetical protein